MADRPSGEDRGRAQRLLTELEGVIETLGELTERQDAEALAKQPELLNRLEEAIKTLRELA